jgi:hypothetical protein
LARAKERSSRPGSREDEGEDEELEFGAFELAAAAAAAEAAAASEPLLLATSVATSAEPPNSHSSAT